ncbi:MAG: tetratricopeptide repeat protein [Deltaproteobacteria bacterium]|nr:tetratricopeptide repeat protein [Deltaproteobacteria bacterium]
MRRRLLVLPLLLVPFLAAGPSAAQKAGIAKPATSSSVFVPTGKLASGLEALERSEYAAAEKDLKSVTGKDAARATVGLARAAYDTGRYADAETLAKKAAGLAGKDVEAKADALGWQGMALLAVGKIDEAIKACESMRDEPKAPRARGVLVEAYVRKGDRDEARNIADALESDSEGEDPVYKDPASLACVGRAAHAVRHVKYANSTFKEAHKLQKGHVETNIAWARLFLDWYDPGHAEESVRDVLKSAPDNPWGHLLRAEVKLAQAFDWDTAHKELDLALKVNPKMPRAHFVRGSMALHDLDIKATKDAVGKGLAIDPNALDLLSLEAAARYLDDDLPGYEKAKAEVFKRNATYGDFYVNVGEFADWEHRYDDLVTMMREATKIDPKNGKAWAELGFNLLRRGDEKDGLEALDTAYKNDRYNVRLVNMLNLFEKTLSSKYQLVDGTGAAKVFKFRFHKEETDLLGHYVPATMAKAWETMVKKYGFTPKNPIQIEIFPEREHFSVRTDGVPNMGPTGVCFGRVITAVSPKKESSNWGLVLWHELGHVFAIQLSKNHVPRWFTEGLSEYETIVQRPEWRRSLDPQLWQALEANRIPKVADLNRAFTHARTQGDVIVAYYASSQIIVFMAETYGFPKLVTMLKLWGEGKKTPDVIKGALGLSADQVDEAFKVWVKKRLARFQGQFIFDASAVPDTEDAEKASAADPKSAPKMATLAAAYYLDRKYKDADATAQKAVSLDSKNQLARYISAKLAYGLRKDLGETKTHVQAIISAGGDGYVVQNMLADLAEAQKDKKGLRAALEKAHQFDPSQIETLVDLWQLADSEGRADDALALLRKMVKMDPHERLPWKKLMGTLAQKGLWDELIQVGEGAVFVDVYAPEVHALYARALTMKGRTKDAHEEVEAGLSAKPKPEGEAMLRVEKARALWKEKKTPQAKAELEAAAKLDPKSPDVAELKGQMK